MRNKMEVKGDIYCAGVYGIRRKSSENYLYIGSSIEVNDALSRHVYNLKRGLYANGNKNILQKYYDMEELVFEVIKTSCFTKIKNMTFEQKESLQKELSVLEEFYINLYKNTCCNAQRSVKQHSSNHDEWSTYRRSIANRGKQNPRVKYDEKMIANILWLKENGFSPKQIEQMYRHKGIKDTYISILGVYRWIYLKPQKPDWIA